MDYIPLHLGAVERSGDLHRWIQSWWPEEQVSKLRLLTPDDWFELDDQGDCVLWSPPPAAADVAIEMMITRIHRESWRMHVCIIPQL